MKKKFLFSYFGIVAALLILLSISRSTSDNIRNNIGAILAPFWNKIASIKGDPKVLSSEETIQKLQLENQLLKNELAFQDKLLVDKQWLDTLMQKQSNIESIQTNYSAYLQNLKKSILYRLQAIPARIIFRSQDTFYNSFWINVGEMHNKLYPIKVICKNSPVLVGNSIVGVIDFVGSHQSRVTMITDPRLTPSVRVVRGGEQEGAFADQIEAFLSLINQGKVAISESDSSKLTDMLKQIKGKLQPEKKSFYLAKGELQGGAYASGRLQANILKGTGFNYDFPDEEGGARDLRTGHLLSDPKAAPQPILKLHDLLVTTGFDGIFPPNLKVGTISKIELLKEGDYYYEVEAKPSAGNLNDLSLVFVIPPMET